MKKPIKTQLPKRLKMTYKKEIETQELDFVVYDEVFGKKWDDSDREQDIISGKQNKNWAGESNPISIKMVRDFLDKLEKAGSTYVEIMHHSDHHSYVFNGLTIVEATQKECQQEKEKEEKINEIRKEINQLESKYKILQEKIKTI